MKITIEEALVRTATVEIKSLTVSGRQVTLAVFRQLDQAELIDYDLLKLNGVVWGRVNYHPDCGRTEARHIHLIWQSGTELKRDCVFSHNTSAARQDHSTAWDAAFLELVAAAICEDRLVWKGQGYSYGAGLRFSIGDFVGSVELGGSLNTLAYTQRDIQAGRGDAACYYFGSSHMTNREAVVPLKAKVREEHPLSYDAAYAAMVKVDKERKAYNKDWVTLYAKLEAVQQLFIAV